MNKSLIIGVIILLVLIIISGLIYIFLLSKYVVPLQNVNTQPPMIGGWEPWPSDTSNLRPVPAAPQTWTVNIKDFESASYGLGARIGDTVKWINSDSVPHQIIGDGFSSPILYTGDSYSFTFRTSGTFNFHCAIHPAKIGTILIRPKN